MSIQQAQSRIKSLQKELTRLNKRRSDKSKQIADKMSRTVRLRSELGRTSSQSMLQNKSRQIERLEKEVSNLQRDVSDVEKQIADKTEKLHKAQNNFYDEQGREQKKLEQLLERESLDRQAREQQLLSGLKQAIPLTGTALPLSEAPASLTSGVIEPSYDAFICHASEDKDELVRPLAEELIARGLNVWYDDFVLQVGDSLRRSIDKGLAKSQFGIVVLSPSFFAKDWPQYELDGLVAKEMNGQKVILPLWHRVSKNDVFGYSPTLADRVALNTTTYTIQELAERLAEAIG